MEARAVYQTDCQQRKETLKQKKVVDDEMEDPGPGIALRKLTQFYNPIKLVVIISLLSHS